MLKLRVKTLPSVHKLTDCQVTCGVKISLDTPLQCQLLCHQWYCSWQKCPVWGSNSRPSDYETDALPTALTRQTFWVKASFRHTQIHFYRLWLIEILKGMMDRFLTWKVGLCLLCHSMHYLDWLDVLLWGLVTSLDPLLGQLQMIQISQNCPLWGSNSRPSDYETDALPTALRRQTIHFKDTFEAFDEPQSSKHFKIYFLIIS